MMKSRTWIPCSAILLLGGILLFSNLYRFDIWGDEIFTFPKGNNYAEVLKYTKAVAITVHPPLYNFIQFTYSRLFSDMDTVANRAFYAFFGFLNIILAYLLGKKLFDRKTGLVAAFLCATSPFLVMYSRMLRYYPMNTFFILLVFWLFLRFRESGKWKDGILFTLAGTALAYGNYLGIIFLVVLYLSLLLDFKQTLKRYKGWLLAALVMFILYLPWLPVVIDQIGRQYHPYPELAHEAEVEHPRMAQKGFGIQGIAFNSLMKLGFLGYVFTLGETTYPWRWFLTVPVFFSFLLLFLRAVIKIRAPGEENLRFLIFLLLVALLILIPLSEIHRNFSSRTFQLPSKIIFLLPIFLLITARAWGSLRKSWLQALLAVLIVCGNAYGLNNYFSGKQFLNPKYLAPWRQIQKDIENTAAPQDLVITDEEGLPHEMKITHCPIEVFGLVNALDKVERTYRERGPFHVFLVLRYRGDEQITMETLIVKDQLSQYYPLVDTWNYVPIDAEVKPFWKRVLDRDPPEHLVQVFVFRIDSLPASN